MSVGDTLVQLVLIVGNIFVLSIFAILKFLGVNSYKTDSYFGFDENKEGKQFVFNLLRKCLLIIVGLIDLILMIKSRKDEYKADNFALENGYGSELVEVLYTFKKLDLGYKPTLMERLKSSHPHLDKRIARLEQRLETETA